MILKTDQLLKFSQFCKENELFFSSDRISDLIIFLKKNELDNQDTEINFFVYSKSSEIFSSSCRG